MAAAVKIINEDALKKKLKEGKSRRLLQERV